MEINIESGGLQESMMRILKLGDCCIVKILTKEEADVYRKMPVGIEQTASVIRSVAERDGERRVLEITASGYNITSIKA